MKIILFDDHALFAKSLEFLLATHVESFIHYNQVIHYREIIQQAKPDIVLMDIHLGNDNGLDIGESLLKLFPHIKLVFLSGYDLTEYHNRAIQIGARGFINKSIEPEKFLQMLNLIIAGKTIFPETDHLYYDKLTQREKEILQRLSDGETQQNIADLFKISRRTVNNHTQAIMMKLGVNSTVSAIVKGIEYGIIHLNNNR